MEPTWHFPANKVGLPISGTGSDEKRVGQFLKNVLRQRGSQIEQILPLRPLSIDQSEIGFLEWLHADFFQLLNPLYLPHDNCRPANACSACALFAFAKRMGRLCCGLRRLDFVQEELEWCRLPTATLENVQ